MSSFSISTARGFAFSVYFILCLKTQCSKMYMSENIIKYKEAFKVFLFENVSSQLFNKEPLLFIRYNGFVELLQTRHMSYLQKDNIDTLFNIQVITPDMEIFLVGDIDVVGNLKVESP